jgi:hypothetical protein
MPAKLDSKFSEGFAGIDLRDSKALLAELDGVVSHSSGVEKSFRSSVG